MIFDRLGAYNLVSDVKGADYMETVNGVFIALSVIYVIVLFCIAFLGKKSFRYIAINAIIGLAILFALSLLSNITGFTVPINAYSLTISGLCGVPGIIMLLLLNIIFLI